MSIEGDLMAYLQTIPGVITVGDQGGDLYIRGGTPSQNYVLIDNIPIVKPFHISNLFSAFPEQAISNVDVMAGGFDNEFMGGTSAIIDATLKTGNFRSRSSSASFSPYISTLFYEGPVRENASSLMINGRLSTIRDFSGYLGTREQDMQFYDVITRYSLQGDGFNCNVSGIVTGDEGRVSTRRENYLRWSNVGVGLRCFGFDESFNHPYEISIGYSIYKNSEGSRFNTIRKASVAQSYIRLDLQDYLLNQKIDYGFNLILQDYSANISEKFTSLDFFGVKVPVFQVYAKTEFKINESIRILPSIGSQSTTLSKSTFEPRLRALWRPNGSSRSEISFATGIYHQIMDGITDQRDAGTTFTVYRPNKIGEPPPRSFHLIGGLKNRLTERLITNFEIFYKKNKDIPVSKWTPEAKIEIETARANSESYGADFRIKYESRNFFGALGYGWSKVEYRAGIDDLGAWINGEIFEYSPPHDQRHKFNALGNIKLGKYTASMSWDVGSGLPYTQVIGFDLLIPIRSRDITEGPGIPRTLYSEPYGKRLPYYHRLDVSIKRGFYISENFTMNAELGSINLYDRSNVFYVDLNTVERVNQTPFLPYFSIKASIK
ncbi:MAG: TonB-dependent receptor [Balneola sp.]